MLPNPNDNDLRDLFAALHEDDAQEVPTFESFWEEALARREQPYPQAGWVRYTTAAVLLLGLAFSAVFMFQPREAMSITKWRSPTTQLLQPPPPVPDATALPSGILMDATRPSLDQYVPPTQVLWPDAIPPAMVE